MTITRVRASTCHARANCTDRARALSCFSYVVSRAPLSTTGVSIRCGARLRREQKCELGLSLVATSHKGLMKDRLSRPAINFPAGWLHCNRPSTADNSNINLRSRPVKSTFNDRIQKLTLKRASRHLALASQLALHISPALSLIFSVETVSR